MNRRVVLSILGTTAVVLALLVGNAQSQQKSLKEQLIGTWILVSSVSIQPDGTKTDSPNRKGIVIYTSDGHFAFVNVRADLPKLAASDPARATWRTRARDNHYDWRLCIARVSIRMPATSIAATPKYQVRAIDHHRESA